MNKCSKYMIATTVAFAITFTGSTVSAKHELSDLSRAETLYAFYLTTEAESGEYRRVKSGLSEALQGYMNERRGISKYKIRGFIRGFIAGYLGELIGDKFERALFSLDEFDPAYKYMRNDRFDFLGVSRDRHRLKIRDNRFKDVIYYRPVEFERPLLSHQVGDSRLEPDGAPRLVIKNLSSSRIYVAELGHTRISDPEWIYPGNSKTLYFSREQVETSVTIEVMAPSKSGMKHISVKNFWIDPREPAFYLTEY